jgi:hypothetical protein
MWNTQLALDFKGLNKQERWRKLHRLGSHFAERKPHQSQSLGKLRLFNVKSNNNSQNTPCLQNEVQAMHTATNSKERGAVCYGRVQPPPEGCHYMYHVPLQPHHPHVTSRSLCVLNVPCTAWCDVTAGTLPHSVGSKLKHTKQNAVYRLTTCTRTQLHYC